MTTVTQMRPAMGMWPLTGMMVEPFPEPSAVIGAAFEELEAAAAEAEGTDEDLQRMASLPRPWDPGTCPPHLRRHVWNWCDQVAEWINTQHLWKTNRPGIPACWPAHPHIAHDLPVLACARFLAGFATTPTPLEEWHHYTLPGFLDRLVDRLGDGCQPGRHMPAPRAPRNDAFLFDGEVAGRAQRFASDAAGEAPAYR